MPILSGKTALISGATGVIGAAIARSFARRGCGLVLSGRSGEKLAALKTSFDESKTTVASVVCDVTKDGDIKALLKGIDALDVLVLAHGTYGYIGPIAEADPEAWMRAINVNLLGTVLCIKHAIPLLEKSKNGKIVTFAGGGEGPLPSFSSYVASKAAILRLTETLAQELKEKNIEINAISPGAVDSGLNKELMAAGPERAGKKMYEQTLKQMSGEEVVSAEKAAALAVFLASEESNGLSGKNISAVWDHWQDIPKHLKELRESDVYAMRRIKPKDRGYDW